VGKWEGVGGPGILKLFGPYEIKLERAKNSRAQPPPTSPRNGYARIHNIMHRAE
jgi:hypothetical protein